MQAKKLEESRRRETEKFRESARLGHEKFRENTRLGKERPPWNVSNSGNFFEPPSYDEEPSMTSIKNEFLTGIYGLKHPDFKPPHHESNVFGGWTYHQTNLRGEMLYEFKDKERQGTPMSAVEKMYKERLDRSIEKATALAQKDSLERTDGSIRKELLVANADEQSCLRKDKPVWQVATPRDYFEPPRYSAKIEPYGLADYIMQPERAMSFKTNIVTSAANSLAKSFWRPTKTGPSGANRRYVQAQELLNRNTRGCPGTKPDSPSQRRPPLLKGKGVGCFTCFREALQEPTFTYVSPADRSGPP
jgi:hypothetical protein